MGTFFGSCIPEWLVGSRSPNDSTSIFMNMRFRTEQDCRSGWYGRGYGGDPGCFVSNPDEMRECAVNAQLAAVVSPPPIPKPAAEQPKQEQKKEISINDYIPDALKGYIPAALKDNPAAIAVLFIIVLYLLLRR